MTRSTWRTIIVVGCYASSVDFEDEAEARAAITAARYRPAFTFAALFEGKGALMSVQYQLKARFARGLKGQRQ